MGFINDPSCSQCGEVEKADYYLRKLPAYINTGVKHLGACVINYNLFRSISP